MTRDQVYLITDALRFLPLAVGVLGGIAGLWLLGRSPRAGRPDRSLAVKAAAVLAVVAALGILFFASALGSAWGGSGAAGLAAGFPLAVAAAALVFVSGIGAYALLARPGVGAIAAGGVLAGPLLLAGATAFIVDATNEMRWKADQRMFAEQQEQGREAAEARNSRLHVSARDIRVVPVPFHDPATGSDITVFSSVSLTLVLLADTPIDFYGPEIGYPEVRLLPGGNLAAEMRGAWPATTGNHLPAGETAWRVDFAYTADQLAGRMSAPPHGPGEWILELSMLSAEGRFHVTTPIQLEAPAST